jgi:hypothetical protein
MALPSLNDQEEDEEQERSHKSRFDHWIPKSAMVTLDQSVGGEKKGAAKADNPKPIEPDGVGVLSR